MAIEDGRMRPSELSSASRLRSGPRGLSPCDAGVEPGKDGQGQDEADGCGSQGRIDVTTAEATDFSFLHFPQPGDKGPGQDAQKKPEKLDQEFRGHGAMPPGGIRSFPALFSEKRGGMSRKGRGSFGDRGEGAIIPLPWRVKSRLLSRTE